MSTVRQGVITCMKNRSEEELEAAGHVMTLCGHGEKVGGGAGWGPA